MPKSQPRPIQFTPLRKEQFASDEGVSFVNLQLSQIVNAINRGSGQAGQVVNPAGFDVAGGTVTGLGSPTEPGDAVSLAHSQANYGATAVGSQLDIGGNQTLKGLAAVYAAVQPGNGVSGTIVIPKLTTTNGSITVKNGIIVGFVNPT